MNQEASELIDLLELQPHPEGGYYRETFRAPLEVAAVLPTEIRSASTAIYFLLTPQTFSALHRVKSDEIWHFYDGDPIELHTIDELGEHTVHVLGRDCAAGQRPQVVIPAGVWQAAKPMGARFSLCGCTVAPGFDFQDFEMPTREELLSLFPRHRTVIASLTRI